MSNVPREHVTQAESVQRAQEKVDAQRHLLAAMRMTDPQRPEQERILDVVIQNAALAKLSGALAPED